jgi:hypothetical protein
MRRAGGLLFLLVLLSGCVASRVGEPQVPAALDEATVPAAQVAAGERLFPIRDGGRFGFIDASGAVAIAPRFEAAGGFSEGLARVQYGGRWGYVDPAGELVIAPRFLDAGDFRHGRARVVLPEARFDLGSRQARSEDRRFATYITPAGQPILEPDLSVARDFAEAGGAPLAVVSRTTERRLVPLGLDFLRFLSPTVQRRDGWYGLDASGAEAVAFREAGRMSVFSEGLAAYQERPGFFRRAPHWGYLDARGRVAIEPRFEAAGPFSEGLAAVASGGRYGFVSPDGAWAIEPRFEQAGPFRDGRARVRQQGRWGFIDPAGALAIAADYDAATDFSEGLAAVGRDGRFGYIRPDGSAATPLAFSAARPFRGGLAFVRGDGREGYITPAGEFVWSRAVE